MKRTTFVAAAALLLGVATSGQAQAESAPGCSSVTQIGNTAYIGAHGQKWASVKQFKGCGKNWGYIYTWTDVHEGGAPYTPAIVIELWGGPDYHEPYGYAGGKHGSYRQKELWTTGTDTVNICTSAHGEWRVDGDLHEISTEIRC